MVVVRAASGWEHWLMSIVNRQNRLALGTVQFGLPYGVANQSGQVSLEEVGQILESARQAGVRTLDTATAYGESEVILGQQDLQEFAVVTKLPEVPADCLDVSGWVQS